ncbi:hypothetical protein GCM10011613_00420 [Cellvibrio zantedeschiae]|uniref:DUF72 domain-containing protein n=1 Tax=Cellvibrio zantedeschiae TaxID=1237077 RepID=A0ABQ3AMU4_9GAMM|nr:DUF72 domain-containing protein [Cellvibrio zantedeschiae]GGY61005.1 hypothetical protein GCM10011613_00420 [Cellvibrio zantedeschiae]
MSEIRVGISGWRYVPWRGSFYPEKLIQKRELYYASRTVNSIEINGSFYAFQTPKSYTSWYSETPDNFVFSIKGPRLITHLKRLRDIETPLADFFASGLLDLDEKLGPILWQFPPTFKFNKTQFRNFLTLLPRTTHEAIAYAQNSTAEKKYSTIKNIISRPLRYSIEIRNESFRSPEFIELLREFDVALVCADTAGRWPQMEDITSDFIYMRLHGDTELYNSGYSAKALDYWYERIKIWSEGGEPEDAKLTAKQTARRHKPRDVFCYFDNTDKLWAPYDARKILEKFDLAKDLEEAPGELSDTIKKLLSRKKNPDQNLPDLF